MIKTDKNNEISDSSLETDPWQAVCRKAFIDLKTQPNFMKYQMCHRASNYVYFHQASLVIVNLAKWGWD